MGFRTELIARLLSKTLFLYFLPVSMAIAQSGNGGDPWAKTQRDGKGTIKVYWYESKPFIYRTADGHMKGIEPDILGGFQKYLEDTHRISVNVEWIEANSFVDVYDRVRQKKEEGTLGISSFSITPERKDQVGFSPPYMADICVLISSKNVPIVKDTDEFNRVFSKLKAVTIKGTTYEQDLLKIRESQNLSFSMSYIPSSQNILRTIEPMDNAFGFIDLPVYMMIFQGNPSVNVRRQNLFPVKREGYAFIFPSGSDWGEPLTQYFNNPGFKPNLESTISSYIDIDLYHFVEGLAIESNDPVILLTKEKEIQQRDILGKSAQLVQETRRTNFLIAFVAVIFTFLLIIILMYRKRNEQKQKIEAQGKSLSVKTEQLEKRNEHLVALDDEKNNLIKILAHDLRTPINHVQGLAQVFLLSNPELAGEQRQIISNISDAAVRLNKMITHILDIDALENNRVKVFMDDVPIANLVKKVVQSFDKQAQKKSLRLEFLDANEKSIIKGDSLFLIQMFENLISNAIKFSSPGKAVSIVVAESNDFVRISVADEGPGLTEEDKGKVFKKFQRLSAQPTGGEVSLGLGLSIVKKYAELMAGRVWFESETGKGATFFVEFRKNK